MKLGKCQQKATMRGGTRCDIISWRNCPERQEKLIKWGQKGTATYEVKSLLSEVLPKIKCDGICNDYVSKKHLGSNLYYKSNDASSMSYKISIDTSDREGDQMCPIRKAVAVKESLSRDVGKNISFEIKISHRFGGIFFECL